MFKRALFFLCLAGCFNANAFSADENQIAIYEIASSSLHTHAQLGNLKELMKQFEKKTGGACPLIYHRVVPGKILNLYDVCEEGSKGVYKKRKENLLNVAYLFWHSTSLPSELSKALNENFDMVLVPYESSIPILVGSNVKIPIFSIQYPLRLEPFFSFEKEKAGEVFHFGSIGTSEEPHNFSTLIDAFHKAFGNDEKMQLELHLVGDPLSLDPIPILLKIKKLGIKNIALTWGPLTFQEYEDKIKSFDTYVSLSKCEAYPMDVIASIAAGIPSIVSRTAGNRSVYTSNLTFNVRSTIYEPAFNDELGLPAGCHFNSKIEDVAAALIEVYKNYADYLSRAKGGREFARQFESPSLEDRYELLFEPTLVQVDKANKISDILATSSKELYNKLVKIYKMQNQIKNSPRASKEI